MRKLLYVMLLIAPVLVFGVGETASEDATFQFIIPEIVGVNITNANITWDFSNIGPTVNPNNPAFPPASFATAVAYEPSSPAARPYQTIDYLVWGFGSTSWELTVKGDADPGNGIALGDIEYADSPPVLWTPFSTVAAQIQTGSANTDGWLTMYQDYHVLIDGDETAGSSCVITYTITTL